VATIYSDLATTPGGLLQQMLMIVMENANIGVLEYGGGFEYRALRNGVEDFVNTGVFDTAGEAKELDGIIRNILVGRIFPEIEGNPRSVRLQELSMIIQDVLQKLDLLKQQESSEVEKQPLQYYRGDADEQLYESSKSRRQLRKLILQEFKFTGKDFTDDFDLLGGGPPPAAVQEPSGGGGGGKIHQLVRINFEPGSEFNPAAYAKTPIDMSPGSHFGRMREIYNSFSNDTKNKLYQMFPGGIDPESEDSVTVWDFRSAYINLLNTMDDAVPTDRDYEYFTIFHPDYASGENKSKLIDLYRRVTGYTPDEEILNEYEIIMHSASALF